MVRARTGAAISKTIKDQTVDQPGGSSSILVRQRREREEMDRLMDQYLTLDDLHQRERVLKQLFSWSSAMPSWKGWCCGPPYEPQSRTARN